MINKVTLVGRLGSDPEVRNFDNSKKVCNFSVATSENYTDREGKKVENTEWHRIEIWIPGLVDVAEKYLTKGSLVYLEGKLTTRKWTDDNNVGKYTTSIVCNTFRMLEPKNQSHEQQTRQQTPQSVEATQNEEIYNDLPF